MSVPFSRRRNKCTKVPIPQTNSAARAPCRSIVVRAYRKKDTGGSQDTTGRGREKEELTGTVQYVSLINTNLPRKPEPGYPLPPHDLG